MTIMLQDLKYIILYLIYQLPEAPPPPDDPPPPEKPDPPEPPDDHDPPELPDDNTKPPIDVFPLVRRSFPAFLYHWEFLRNSFADGKTITYVIRQIKAPFVPRTMIGNTAQNGIRNK
jgi:hypothetical protein